ncbi:putative ATP-dependent RNA helicase DHX57 [Acropora cervicornis]|uniref:ATP-dependent RNA helicase DHX57 n=1 Tax=Acropora cervicornis TaxID=6130 RepID=A0AAD9QU16_ACRCE|nr:putative ATP-dependent RNA helicase DHX57 [Acropora cervicornis]
MDHEKINYDLLVAILEWIVAGEHEYPKSGAILVFLPGMGEIMTLLEQLQNSKTFSPKSSDRFRIIPLHSMLSSEEQSLVFKIELDLGMIPRKVWSVWRRSGSRKPTPGSGAEELGELHPGSVFTCSPITGLNTKWLVTRFQPPSDEAIKDSIKRLHNIGAFDVDENLTSLGYHLAALPVDVSYKVREMWAELGCCRRVGSDGSSTEHDLVECTVSKGSGDSCLGGNWLEVMERGQAAAGYQFCKTNFLSMKTLQMIASLKCQYAELLAEIGFIQADLTARKMGRLAPRTGDGVLAATGEMVNHTGRVNANSKNQKLVLGVVCAALFPNVVQVVKPDVKYKASATGAVPVNAKAAELKFWTKNDGQVFVHPKSVNFQVNNYESPFLVYHEKVKTSKVYIRDCSMVSVYALLLFCGDSLSVNLEKGVFVISIDDGWIRFSVSMQKIANLVRDLRAELDRLLESKIENPSLDITKCGKGSTIINAIVQLISTQ